MTATIAHTPTTSVTAQSLRVEANPDGTRYVVAEGAHSNVVLTSDRRELRAHLLRMLAETDPTDAERVHIAVTVWQVLLDLVIANSDVDDPDALRASITELDVVGDGTKFAPNTVEAVDADGEVVGGVPVEGDLTDEQLDDLRDLSGPWNRDWAITIPRPTASSR